MSLYTPTLLDFNNMNESEEDENKQTLSLSDDQFGLEQLPTTFQGPSTSELFDGVVATTSKEGGVKKKQAKLNIRKQTSNDGELTTPVITPLSSPKPFFTLKKK